MHGRTSHVLLLTSLCALGACERQDDQVTPDRPVFGDAAGALPGVVLVADVGHPAPASPLAETDAAITARVVSALSADATLADQAISVSTSDGIVSLRGAVDSVSAVKRASAIVLAVAGVAGVDNGLSLMVSH